MQETWVPSLGHEDPLEKEMATHSSILAWRILWTEESGGEGVEKEERRSWAGGESGVGGGGEDRHRDGDGGMEVVGEE